MKVLEKQDVSDWSIKHTCAHCDSVLQVEANDLVYTHHSGYYNETSYDTYGITCPVCRANFNIPSDQIPKLVKLQAQNKPTATDYYNK